MRVVTAAAVLAAVASLSAAAQAPSKQTFQCWTDKSGQRMCGDRVPPEYAGQKRDTIKDGRVIGTTNAAKTPEEIAEEERKKQAAVAAAKQAEYDRALLETYRSAKDIESMRDERLALIDSRIAALEKNSGDTDKGLEGLRARADGLTKEGKKVDARLANQIKEFEKAQKQNHRALERNRKERESVQQHFDSDLVRYSELRGLPLPVKAAPAQPADPAKPAEGQAATPAEPAQPADPAKGG